MAGLSAITGSGLPPTIPGVDASRPLPAGAASLAPAPLAPTFAPPAFRGQFYSIYQPDFAIASAVSSAGIRPDPPAPLLDIAPKKAPAPIPGLGQSSSGQPNPPAQPDPAQAAALQDQASASAASQKRVRLFANLSDIHARIAYANGTGDTGAAQQLQQTATSINGELQGQTFAGIGNFPPKPFAPAEIPNIYLNTAA